mgnify:CR=1 FL=1
MSDESSSPIPHARFGVSLLGGAALLSVGLGLLLGDRSEPTKVAMELIDGDNFRTELSDVAAEAYDRGVEDLSTIGKRSGGRSARAASARAYMQAARSNIFGDAPRSLARPITAGMWLELALCLGIDAAGTSSLFNPGWGELSDVFAASLTAFAINLLFDWCALRVGWAGRLDIAPRTLLPGCPAILCARPRMRPRPALPHHP